MAVLKSETIPNITAYADACQGGFSGTYAQWCEALGKLSGDVEAANIDKVHATLYADRWANGVYNLESLYPSSTYLFLFIDKDGDNITDDQLAWWYAADMLGSLQNRIIAHEETPEVDIPVIITMIRRVTLGD